MAKHSSDSQKYGTPRQASARAQCLTTRVTPVGKNPSTPPDEALSWFTGGGLWQAPAPRCPTPNQLVTCTVDFWCKIPNLAPAPAFERAEWRTVRKSRRPPRTRAEATFRGRRPPCVGLRVACSGRARPLTGDLGSCSAACRRSSRLPPASSGHALPDVCPTSTSATSTFL